MLVLQDDVYTHLYTLIVRSDNTYEVKIDNKKVQDGKLEEDWDFLLPKKIKVCFSYINIVELISCNGNSCDCNKVSCCSLLILRCRTPRRRSLMTGTIVRRLMTRRIRNQRIGTSPSTSPTLTPLSQMIGMMRWTESGSRP